MKNWGHLRRRALLRLGSLVAGLTVGGCSAEHVVGSLGFGVAARYRDTGAEQLVVGDFDGDGQSDVVTQKSDGVTVCLRVGSALGTLGAARCQSLSDAATAIAALPQPTGPTWLLRASSALSTWTLGADGMFGRTAKLSLAAPTAARGLQLADLDADGRLDVLVAEPAPSQLEAVLSTAAGLQQAGVYPLVAAAQTLLYRDLDGDRHKELAVLARDSIELWGERGVARWASCAKPHFSQPIGLWAVSRWVQGGTALLVVDAATGLLNVMRAQSAMDFVFVCGEVALLPGVVGGAASGWLAQTADVDGDGEDELILAEPSGRVSVFVARDGDVTRLTEASFGTAVGSMTLADLNHDELPEILAVGSRGDEVLVLSNLFRK